MKCRAVLVPLFLFFGLVAHGQGVEETDVAKPEYPSSERYELGYVQPGKENFCRNLLSGYERSSPDNMNNYYRSDLFVQWTSGRSAKGQLSIGRNENMDWVYAPIFNNGVPYLFVRLDNFKFPFHPRNFVFGAGHSFVGAQVPFKGRRSEGGVRQKDVQDGLQDPAWVPENDEAFNLFVEARTYYTNIRQVEEELKIFKNYLDTQYSPEKSMERLKKAMSRSKNCDFDVESEVSKRRLYLREKKFFLTNEEVEVLREEFEKNKQQYPNLGESSLLDEVVANTPKHIVPPDFREINFVYFKGEFYIYIRKTRSDTVVVLHFPDAENYEEVCYIGPREPVEIDLEK